MNPTYLKRFCSHFRQLESESPCDIPAEVEKAKNATDVRTLVPLTREGILHLSRYFPPVKNAADLDALPEKLKGDSEYGFSPLFDPALIDACCTRGIFPLTQEIGDGFYIFTPKVHKERAICALVSNAAERNTIGGFPYCEDADGIFNQWSIGVSKKLLKDADEATRRPSFEVFLNREADLVDILTLIRKQHGENWLCKPLRMCLLHIFFNVSRYTTKVVFSAIRRRKYAAEGSQAETTSVIAEGELVAGEVGFLVGDIYTSASGAYCLSGGGVLQLCVTGMCMRAAGCRVWDLGMMMDYKKNLHCVEIPRRNWMRIVAARLSNDNAAILSYFKDLENGCPVSNYLRRPCRLDKPDLNSKAQQKKRLKRAAYGGAKKRRVSE